MKKVVFFLFLPFVSFAEFGATDSANLADIKSGLLADSGSGSFVSQGLTSFIFFNQRVSAWGGNFIKTVGDAAHKFVSEFGSAGWFTAVKASIGVIQADVGRIYTALTTVNDHLDIIEGDVSSIKDTTESIDTTVSSIDSHTSTISSNLVYWFLTQPFISPERNRLLYNVYFPSSGDISSQNKSPTITQFSVSANRDTYYGFFDLFQGLLESNYQYHQFSTKFLASIVARQWYIQSSIYASTNLLQKILDTNDVWYTRIYNKIPNSISISNQLEAVIAGISNININIASESHDGSYTPESFNHSYGFVLDNPFPSISRDVQNANMLGMPVLTGDFRRDIVLLASYINAYSTSISSSQMDILTNLQVVANAILDARSQAEEKSRETETKNREIIESGESLEGSIDSVSSYFDLIGGNSGIGDYKDNSTRFGSVLDSTFNIQDLPEKITMRIPTMGDDSASFLEFFINLNDHGITSTLRTFRQFMAFFWWALGFGIALFALNLGIRLVGWLSSIFFPSTYGPAITAYANNKEAGII